MTTTITSNEALLDFIARGQRVKYVFFWGHTPPKTGVNQSCFSQWYPARFEEHGCSFATAEHYMMYHKAKLFGDDAIAAKVLLAKTPGEAKKLGRLVEGFDNDVWEANRFEIVVKANELKFAQNPELKDFLLGTGKRVLVEASPVDKIWGIGLAADHEHCEQPKRWRGQNLLGYALMVVRDNS